MNSITSVRGVRHKFRSLIDVHPALYLPLCRVRPKTRHITVSKNTELVIEGFPRSGNTFAVAAFTLAQGRPVKLARHLHAPAQVIAAVRRGIPTCVLIRRPKEAVLSLMVRVPHISVEQALKDYVRFYSSISRYRAGFVIGQFDEVTKNFSSVIKRINAHFGTKFRVFEHTEDNVKTVFQIVEEMDKEDTGRKSVQEGTVARPSEERDILKASLRSRFENRKAKRLLARAEQVYNQYVTMVGGYEGVTGGRQPDS